MNLTQYTPHHLPSCTSEERARLDVIETHLLSLPQVRVPIKESLHNGVYTRVAIIPGGVLMMGCTLKVRTTLTVVGRVEVTVGGRATHVDGCEVFEGEAGRKTCFLTHTDTTLIMTFRTDAKDLKAVRELLTDELLQEERDL